MPAPRSIVLACALAAAIVPATLAGATTKSAHSTSTQTTVRPPASAGTLKQGEIHYM